MVKLIIKFMKFVIFIIFCLAGDGSHPTYGHSEKAHDVNCDSPVESIAFPGEPNLGY